MTMTNNIETISGRLGADPKLTYTTKGEAVCELSVGLNNDQSKTIWRKVVTFGKLAEQCSVHLKKGAEVFVRGPVILRKYTNKEGIEKEFLEVKAFSVGQSLV